MWRSLKAPLPPFSTTVGNAETSLFSSSPSGIVFPGSTMAWLTYDPGVSGANILTMMVADEAGARCWPSTQLDDAAGVGAVELAGSGGLDVAASLRAGSHAPGCR